MKEVRKLIDELEAIEGVLGSGIVSKDGRIIYMRLSEEINTETVSIMAATVFGASVTLQTEAKRNSPSRVSIKTEDGDTLVYECGRRALVMVMVTENPELNQIEDIVQRLEDVFSSG
jgi:predicted regulator of Ras-like GTPase activity (Roadblock/LC7/MglB family)